MPAGSLRKTDVPLQLHRKAVVITFFRNSHGSSKLLLLLGGALGDVGSEKFSFFCRGIWSLLVPLPTSPPLSTSEGKELGLFLPALSGALQLEACPGYGPPVQILSIF